MDVNGNITNQPGTPSESSDTQKQNPPGKIHPLIKINYYPRIIGFALFFVIFLTLFWGVENAFLWCMIVLQTIVWPHIAYLIARSSKTPKKTEYRNMYFEVFACGIWVNVVSFSLWPTSAFVIAAISNLLATGGLGLFVRGVALLCVGIIAGIAMFGFNISMESQLSTAFASILLIVVYTSIVSYMSFLYSERLSRQKKNLARANDEIKDKLAITRHEINERMKVEKDLTAAKAKAEEANREKSRFLANMSHEIRTPMNAIIGMTDLALITANEEHRNDYLRTVKESASHLLTVINDILDFSKTESGKLIIEKTDFDLWNLIENVVKSLTFKVQNSQLVLSLDIENDTPRYVKGDPSRVKQILFNIAGNAIKFTPSGSVTITVKPDNSESKGDQLADITDISFTVTDTGIGIPENQLDTIFDSFSQAERNTSKLYGGTGLGLAISKTLVELMGGTIGVRSTENKGSTFQFTIPLQEGSSSLIMQHQNSQLLKQSSGDRSLDILLAEDNPVNIKLAMLVLERLGHYVTVVHTGLEVVKMLQHSTFDLILMDIEMPEMNGIDAAKLIRDGQAGDINTSIPIIAMTAHVLNDVVRECKKAGINHYISKPIDISKLDRIMQGILRES